MAKQGFGGQWIGVCRIGKAIDSKGVKRDITRPLLEKVIANFNAGMPEAPLTIGHPKPGDPAWGWISALRLNGDLLEMRTENTDDQFENMIKEGRFRTRSIGMDLQHPIHPAPRINHVAFLGAEPPAVKGLPEIQFSETAEGESFVLEETINLQENNMGLEDTDVEKVTEGVFEKIKGFFKSAADEPGKTAEPAAANFSEASVKELIAEAVKTVKTEVTAEFTEKLKEKEDELKELKETVTAGTTSGRRAEIVSFVESIPAEKGKHFLKRAGIVEFIESLADADAADKDPAICFSEGEGDKKEEHKFSRVDWFKNYVDAQQSFVEFGEKFGGITATAEADSMVRNDVAKSIENTIGTPADGGEK